MSPARSAVDRNSFLQEQSDQQPSTPDRASGERRAVDKMSPARSAVERNSFFQEQSDL